MGTKNQQRRQPHRTLKKASNSGIRVQATSLQPKHILDNSDMIHLSAGSVKGNLLPNSIHAKPDNMESAYKQKLNSFPNAKFAPVPTTNLINQDKNSKTPLLNKSIKAGSFVRSSITEDTTYYPMQNSVVNPLAYD